jgi:hypothetical protein
MPRSHAFLSLELIEAFEPMADDLGVSEVARSRNGFLGAYRRADGDPDALDDAWVAKREAFLKRHLAQVAIHDEPLWEDGQPTRRHLALIMWAYSPTPARLWRLTD